MSELTSMQAACWFGRISAADFLGGVAAHLYAEFDGNAIDSNRLETALQRVYAEHPILRLKLNAEGIPSINPSAPTPLLETEDLTSLSQAKQQQHLHRKREQWTHQQLDLANGQTARFSLSQLNEGNCRLHVDADMIAIDPSSFCRFMEDLTAFYNDPTATLPPAPSFFAWHDVARADSELKKKRSRDRKWWKARLADIAPAPSLPLTHTSKPAQSHRLSDVFTTEQWHQLKALARQQKITSCNLVLGLFAFALAQATQDKHFRLNVPIFWREPLLADTDRCLGDFANFVLLNINLDAHRTLASLCHDIAEQMIDLLEHSHYEGVNIMRDLSRFYGTAQMAPVVFTAALDLPQENLFSPAVQNTFGPMNWTISQGPQVALDAQAVLINDGLLINWDVRLDALALDWVTKLFNSFVCGLKEVSQKPELLEREFDQLAAFAWHQKAPPTPLFNQPDSNKNTTEKPLSAMQQAYLLGRTAQLPLGGVAMQEFREYRGHMDPAELRQRLTKMVKHHQSLRTRIDSNRLVQYVCDEIVVNLKEIDLKGLSTQAAYAYLESYRDTYSHALFDLDLSPWNITLFHLNDNQLRVFARFDALILDGRSIAALMIELFGVEHTEPPKNLPESIAQSSVEARQRDMDYWQNKLAAITKAPQLPWKTPLHQLGRSKFARNSVIVPATSFRQCCKAGAKQGLFKNSVIMALILELLAQRSGDKHIYVAVPVLPIYSGSFSNHSSFIPVEWQSSLGHLSQQACNLQEDILEGLQHLSFSGVELARMLYEKCGSSAPALPVVVTNGLSWPALADANPMALENGLTQTPQVAIDIRFSNRHNGDLVFDIDYALDAISTTEINYLLAAIEKAIHQIAQSKQFSFDAQACFAMASSPEQQALNLQADNKSPAFCHQQLLELYLEVINRPLDNSINQDTDFISMGLRPQHLKPILKRLQDTYSISLSAGKIFQCRNINDVATLLDTEQRARQSALVN